MDLNDIKLAQRTLSEFPYFGAPHFGSPLIWSDGSADYGPLWLKCENLLPTGSFKIRPALGGILRDLEGCRQRGVVAGSSGNFAQALAFAAHMLGVSAEIVMMTKTAAHKVDATRRWGAKVTLCGNAFEERQIMVEQRARDMGAIKFHPFDSEPTIAFDGTIGLELASAIGRAFTVVVPVSGGGLCAGIAQAVKQVMPGCRVVAVHPEGNPCLKDSFAEKKRIIATEVSGIADALVATQLGCLTFPLIQQYVDETVSVTDAQMLEAQEWLEDQHKLVVEPAGAAAVAASFLIQQRAEKPQNPLVAVLSGGNRQRIGRG